MALKRKPKTHVRSHDCSNLIGELLTAVLIDPCRDKKLTKKQSDLIDEQFSRATEVMVRYDCTIRFKFTPITTPIKSKGKKHGK